MAMHWNKIPCNLQSSQLPFQEKSISVYLNSSFKFSQRPLQADIRLLKCGCGQHNGITIPQSLTTKLNGNTQIHEHKYINTLIQINKQHDGIRISTTQQKYTNTNTRTAQWHQDSTIFFFSAKLDKKNWFAQCSAYHVFILKYSWIIKSFIVCMKVIFCAEFDWFSWRNI